MSVAFWGFEMDKTGDKSTEVNDLLVFKFKKNFDLKVVEIFEASCQLLKYAAFHG